MSECVVRMEMPKSCPCELAGGYDIPLPCFAGHGIPKRCKEFDECVENGTKPDWCPFVCALPEGHGRLIDADALKELMLERKQPLVGADNSKDRYRYMQWLADFNAIKDVKTVVPAERNGAEQV